METPRGTGSRQLSWRWLLEGKGKGRAHAVSTRHSHLRKQVPRQRQGQRLAGNGLPLCCYCVAAQQSCRIQTDSARGQGEKGPKRRRHTVSRCRRGMEMRFRTSSWARSAHFQEWRMAKYLRQPRGERFQSNYTEILGKYFYSYFRTLN